MTFRSFLVFLGIASICAGLSAAFFAAYMQSEAPLPHGGGVSWVGGRA